MLTAARPLPSHGHTLPGHCGLTSESDTGDDGPLHDSDCVSGSSGVFPAASTLHECKSFCTASSCPRCSWISFSKPQKDCSWYSFCDGPSIVPFGSTHVSLKLRDPTPVDAEDALSPKGDRTLIVFLYHASKTRTSMGAGAGIASGNAAHNLAFFVRHGVRPALANPRFSFVVANSGDEPLLLPDLPHGHPRFAVHNLNGSRGFEFINYRRYFCGDARETADAGSCMRRVAAEFSRFIMLPDTVRGPFVPSYVPRTAWPDVLTAQLSESVKLVGPSISCMYCGQDVQHCRNGLHLQGFLLATDRVGLRVLLHHWRAPSSKRDAIVHNEFGSTTRMLAAGYNVAAMQWFWRGHDFHDYGLTQRKCALLSTHATNGTMGQRVGIPSCIGCQWGETDLSPFEIVFVHRSLTENHQQGAAVDYTRMLQLREALEQQANQAV